MNTPNDEHESDARFGEQTQAQPTAPTPPPSVQPASQFQSGPHPGPHISGPQAAPQWSNRAVRDPRRKSAVLAVLLSMMPGLGQVYVGSYRRGFINILVVAALITLLANDMGPLTPLAGLGLAFFWLYNMIDAGRRANHYNMLLQAQAGGQFPEDLDFSDFSGSGGTRAGGIVLMVLGFMFLMNTRFRWDFDWLEEWWPLGFMFLGAYLFWKDHQARKAKQDDSAANPKEL